MNFNKKSLSLLLLFEGMSYAAAATLRKASQGYDDLNKEIVDEEYGETLFNGSMDFNSIEQEEPRSGSDYENFIDIDEKMEERMKAINEEEMKSGNGGLYRNDGDVKCFTGTDDEVTEQCNGKCCSGGTDDAPACSFPRNTICEGSCIGEGACLFGPSTVVGVNSCVGVRSCRHAYAKIGNGSCRGNSACHAMYRPPTRAVIGAKSCIGRYSCQGLEKRFEAVSYSFSIGKGSCNGHTACKQLGLYMKEIIIGNYSCNGDAVCYKTDFNEKDIGESIIIGNRYCNDQNDGCSGNQDVTKIVLMGTAMNVRFNKFGIIDETFEDIPLTAESYPISANEAIVTFLKEGTDAESVVNDLTDFEVIYNVKDLINIVGGPPDHPSDNFDAPYWDKLTRVIVMRNKRGSDKASTALGNEMQLPLRWRDYTVDDVAEAVYDEYPGMVQANFLEDLISGKYGAVQYNTDIIPRRANAQFLRGIIMLADINTWSIRLVGPHNFGAKWFAGRARPEEVAWMIHEDMIEAPALIHREIGNIENFNKATDFTRYNREGRAGSPRHPSWPAMHSAGSNMSFWIQVVMNLTPRQLCEVKKVDFAVSFARTVAGVHFEDDNMAGLSMGQEIMARALPGHLAKTYNSNLNAVAALVNAKRFKWEDYQPLEDCNSL